MVFPLELPMFESIAQNGLHRRVTPNAIARTFLSRLPGRPDVKKLTSPEHVPVNGTSLSAARQTGQNHGKNPGFSPHVQQNASQTGKIWR